MIVWKVSSNYKLVAIDFSRQQELDADPKAIQQIELRQFKNVDDINPDGAESMFVLAILEKIKEKRLKCSQGSVTVL